MKVKIENPEELLTEIVRLIDLYIVTHHESFSANFPELYKIYLKLRRCR